MTKKITFQTNYNNKFSCPKFVHIDIAPPGGIPESVLRNTTFEIHTKDNSHPPIHAELEDLCRLPLKNINSLYLYPSHGMSIGEYILMMKEVRPGITDQTQMAIYFYKQISS